MRRRSTFVHDPDVPADPQKLKVSSDALSFASLPAAREERLTFSFSELPQELWHVLKQSHELHIRWTTEQPYDAEPPFLSRTSPGLHVFYTPAVPHRQGLPLTRDDAVRQRELLCPLLKKVFGQELRCQIVPVSFTTPPILSERFAHISSLQYYSLLPSLENAVEYIQQKVCTRPNEECIWEAERLTHADTFDLDYDSISHSLILTAYWSKPLSSSDSSSSGWTESMTTGLAEAVEVGVLSNEEPNDPYELSLSGFLTVVGEDDKPSPTLFSFPSRHHSLPASQKQDQTYTVSFLQPTGLHPTLQITFPSSHRLAPPTSRPSDSHCALHTYLTLPSVLFPDRYQLSTTDPLFLSSHNLVALRAISGELDLEAPDYLPTLKWGSNVLLELSTPPPSSAIDEQFNVTVPLHLRYLPPSSSGHTRVTIPNPIVFWACTAEDGTRFPVNPFDRVNLGWDGLFGERSMFYQLKDGSSSAASIPGSPRLVQHLDVPVIATEGSWASTGVVEIGTVIVVLLGFVWIMLKAFGGWKSEADINSSGSSSSSSSSSKKTGKETEEKEDKKER